MSAACTEPGDRDAVGSQDQRPAEDIAVGPQR